MDKVKDYTRTRRVREVTVTLTHEDTDEQEAFTLPAGARIIAWLFNVKEAFAGGTTEIDIGVEDDIDYYVEDGDISAVGQDSPSAENVIPGPVFDVPTTVYMVVGAGNTAGEVDVTCLFSMNLDKRV